MKAIDLYAGAGGFTEAAKLAGISVAMTTPKTISRMGASKPAAASSETVCSSGLPAARGAVSPHLHARSQSQIPNSKSPVAIETLPSIALSVRQPWAWLIVNGHKDIENRSRCIKKFFGRVLIHAGERMTHADYEAALLFVAGFDAALADQIPDPAELHRGGLVGVADVCGHGNWPLKTPWWTGPYGYQLKDAHPLPFTPCKARLGFFSITFGVAAELAKNLRPQISHSL